MKSPHRVAAEQRRPVLITGGAGFIGTNLAHRLLSGGNPVIILDNLSRAGVERNLRWLRAQHKERLRVVVADVRDERAVAGAVRQCSQVFHLAAQVAVTASLLDPFTDFEVNVRGTLTVLEAVRRASRPIPVLFTSTNKVYGTLDDLPLEAGPRRYTLSGSAADEGIDETRPIEFHSPYGCSKGAAEQYVLDYARTYQLPTTVFRMSCIYGPHQCGNEDQGWVAHFVLRSIYREPITVHGDGRQVRDLLFVEDLIDAMLFAQANFEAVRGRAFNIGGGPGNTISLLELVDALTDINGEPPAVSYAPGRTPDQRLYVSNVQRFSRATGWRPRVGVREGLRRLHRWMLEHRVALPGTEVIAPPARVVVERRDVELSVGRGV